jgi:hypothetical protein
LRNLNSEINSALEQSSGGESISVQNRNSEINSALEQSSGGESISVQNRNSEENSALESSSGGETKVIDPTELAYDEVCAFCASTNYNMERIRIDYSEWNDSDNNLETSLSVRPTIVE